MKKLIAIIFAGTVVTYFVINNYTPADHNVIIAIASPLTTIAGILFGFVIASSTFMSSNSKNVLIENLKSQKMFKSLMGQLHRTGMWLILSCIFMVVSILSPSEILYRSFTWDYSLLMLGFWCLICGLFDFCDSWRKVRLVTDNL